MTIEYESLGRCFDSDNPILALAIINSERDIPAYGIQVTLMRVDKCHQNLGDSLLA